MLKHPPDFLITTPESLYLLVTAERTRAMLAPVATVIVDEIHAVAGNKRGSHLALTLERLEHLAAQPVQRIGLSATQRPIETVARLLVGAGPGRSAPDGSPRCAIVDSGHRRELDLALELPGDELGAVASAEQMDEILDLIAGHVLGTGRRWCSSTPGGWPSGSPTSWASGSVRGRSPRITAACPRTGGSGSSHGCAAVTCGPWSRPRRWSWASTSGRWSWCARSARRAASAPSCSGSAGPTTAAAGYRPGGCTRRPATSWWNPRRCCAACGPAGSTPCRSRTARWTSWPSRSWRSARPRSGPRTTCWPWSGGPPRSRACRPGTSARSPRWSRRGSGPAAAAGLPTCTGTG